MATGSNGSLRLRLAGSAIGGLVAFAHVPAATAQWLAPWRAASPREIERSLEAEGYELMAPLGRRPGVYLADVSAGPAGYQRLVVDARSGQILERFTAPGRMWGPALAARDEEFGEPPSPGLGGPPLSGEFYGPPGTAAQAKSYGRSGKTHSPAAISPHGQRKVPASKASTANPPLPPPAPRESAKLDGSGLTGSDPSEKQGSDQPKIDPHPTEVDNVPPAAAPAISGSSADGGDKPKVSIVPPALFE